MGTDMDAVGVLLASVLLAALAFGAAAQISKVCLPGSLREWVLRHDLSRMSIYLVAVGAAVVFSALVQAFAGLDLSDTKPPYRSPQFAWGRYMLGGFIFGVGMVMTRGCPARNLVKLGQGNLQSLPVLIVMALTAYVMTRTPVYAEWFAPWVGVLSVDLTRFGMAHQDLASLFGGGVGLNLLFALALGGVLFALAARWSRPQGNAPSWLGALVVGGMVALGYWLTGGSIGQAASEAAQLMDTPQEGLGVQSFTFSAPLGDVVHFLGQPTHTTAITFGVLAVLGVLLGALFSALLRGEFKLSAFGDLREWLITMSGAVLAGVGSVLAMGCTVGHGFSGMATLALGSFVALAAIAAGGVLAHRADRWLGQR